jgi:hypothetical protein
MDDLANYFFLLHVEAQNNLGMLQIVTAIARVWLVGPH